MKSERSAIIFVRIIANFVYLVITHTTLYCVAGLVFIAVCDVTHLLLHLLQCCLYNCSQCPQHCSSYHFIFIYVILFSNNKLKCKKKVQRGNTFSYTHNFLCVPSHIGALSVCLQLQKNTVLSCSALYLTDLTGGEENFAPVSLL